MFKNFGTVFSFSFGNQVKAKGYKVTTILIAVLLLVVPLLLLPGIQLYEKNHESDLDPTEAKSIYTVDERGIDTDLTPLNELGAEGYSEFTYQSFAGVDEALEAAHNGDGYALVLQITAGSTGSPVLQLILPDESNLSTKDADHYREFLRSYRDQLTSLLVEEEEMSPEELMALTMPVAVNSYTVTDYQSGSSEEFAAEFQRTSILDGLSFGIPYVSIMLMYFMVILYCSGVTASVSMEKSSKLMDTMLVSVRPEAMVLGKMLAIVAAAVMQIVLWLVCVIFGLVGGTLLSLVVNPQQLVNFFDLVGSSSATAAATAGAEEVAESFALFTPGGFLMAVLIIVAGFILYCSLAAIGGSFASTKEEAASANSSFTLILVASFLITLNGGGMSSASTPVWMVIFPFTSILVSPGAAILGTMPMWLLWVGLGVTLLLALALVALAGRVYHSMSLYKGNKPNMKQIVAVILGKQTT
jgi:ABC-type Na+ efflux pump permease subunit